MEEFKHDVFVRVLLDKFPFDGVAIIPIDNSRDTSHVESQEIEFLNSGLNLVIYMLEISTVKSYFFPWLIINGKIYSTWTDFQNGFPRGMEEQIKREKLAAKLRGEKAISNY